MGRLRWDDLPPGLRARVQDVLGDAVSDARSQAEGFSPGSADRITTLTGRRAFVKAISRSRNPDGFGLHEQEARVVRQLPRSVQAPRMIGVVEDEFAGDDWIALVLDDVDGRHPGGAGDDSDVAAVLDALDTLPVATGALLTLPRLADELAEELGAWDRMLDAGLPAAVPPHVAAEARAFARTATGAAAVLDGEHLTHVDCRADNLLVDAVGRVWVIDWPWAAVGAHWFDPLTYLLDVLVRGDAVDVERHLATHRLFTELPASAVDAVLAGLAGTFLEKASRPAVPHMPELRGFQRREGLAAAEWLLRRWSARDG
jgi:hypothetical protein